VSPLLIALISIIGTLLVERLYNVPRDIRRNDELISNRDEDLRTWIEDDDAELRKQHLVIMAREARKSAGPDYSLVEYQQLKDQVAHRYRDQLRDAERTVRDLALSEQLPHRFARRFLRKPLPELTAPQLKAATLDHWHESPEDMHQFSEKLREVAEQRRAEAGKPPLRPLERPVAN
jgi:hypothetical protein